MWQRSAEDIIGELLPVLDHMDLAPGEAVKAREEEQEEWLASRKEGRSKFKTLRSRRVKYEEHENG